MRAEYFHANSLYINRANLKNIFWKMETEYKIFIINGNITTFILFLGVCISFNNSRCMPPFVIIPVHAL
jgi:hypothetical protein